MLTWAHKVCIIGYGIIGVALLVFVQARNVYPELLLARLFFSVGAAASSTMVTAILPTMTTKAPKTISNPVSDNHSESNRISTISTSSEETITPSQKQLPMLRIGRSRFSVSRSATSQTAGLVGMFTGLGALVALGVFLPLPARFQQGGLSPSDAIADSYYVVGGISCLVAILCGFGLKDLVGEENKGWKALIIRNYDAKVKSDSLRDHQATPYSRLFIDALKLGFTDVTVGLGYLGGFVARASSVGITLFIPLYVNHYFVSSGLCSDSGSTAPADMKEQCRRAYALAAVLTGTSQTVALLCAPIFGYLGGRYVRFNIPLLMANTAGIVGYVVLARTKTPDPRSEDGGPGIFAVMALLGVSQIGAIVCSLSLLGQGMQGSEDHTEQSHLIEASDSDVARPRSGLHDSFRANAARTEISALLPSHLQRISESPGSRNHLKGSIAGLYSLAGGAGILLLTKLGGDVFDRLSPGAPFYMLAIFNAILLVAVVGCSVITEVRRARLYISI